jgi:hypothetical protein
MFFFVRDNRAQRTRLSGWKGEGEYGSDDFERKLVNQRAVGVIFLHASLAVPFMELLKLGFDFLHSMPLQSQWVDIHDWNCIS